MVRVTARILRKQDDLPRYIVVGSDALEGRRTAFAADVWLNGAGPFRRNVRPWRKGADVFFVNLTAPQCVAAGVATGDSCEVTIAAVEA